MKELLVLSTILLASTAVADNPSATKPHLPILPHERLDSARAELIKAGWVPMPFRGTLDKESDMYQFIKAGYIETGECSQDAPLCNLYYTMPGKCLRVTSKGVVTSKGYDPKTATVVGWRFDCVATKTESPAGAS